MVASAFVDHSARPPPSRKTRRVLSLAGNDRDTSNSIETSDAAAKKLGDQFFEKLAAVFGPTPKLAVLPRPPTNQRGVVRAAFVVAVLLYVSRYSFGNWAGFSKTCNRSAPSRKCAACPSYVGILQSAERTIGYDGDYKYRGGVAYQPSPSRRANGSLGDIDKGRIQV
jgi:hypothetical protein